MMNKLGKQFLLKQKEGIKNYKKFYNSLPSEEKNSYLQWKELEWKDSIVQERIIRLGIEARCFELETSDELEQIAIATLIEDFLEDTASLEYKLKNNLIIKKYI